MRRSSAMRLLGPALGPVVAVARPHRQQYSRWRRIRGALACLVLAHAWLAGSGCRPRGQPWQAPVEAGKDVFLDDGLGFTLPVAFHEVAGGPGRTFRERGASEASFCSIHVQQVRVGTPLPLDEAFAMVIGRLKEQQKVDLLDEQLTFLGDELALTYVADVTVLDTPRRQWGVLVGRPEGLLALFLTVPLEHFDEAALDFQGVLDSLHGL